MVVENFPTTRNQNSKITKCLSPDCRGKPFADRILFFVAVKKRPKEALFTATKMDYGQKAWSKKQVSAPNKYYFTLNASEPGKYAVSPNSSSMRNS